MIEPKLQKRKLLKSMMTSPRIVRQKASLKLMSRAIFMTVAYLILGIMTSCEIEDEYSKPDMSENFGKRIVSLSSFPVKLFWTDQDEIIVVNPEGITGYGVEKNSIRNSAPLESDNQLYSAWLVDDLIYGLTYQGRLSAFDLATLKLTQSFADSVILSDLSPAFSSSHIAYSKYTQTEPNMPSIFLYDIASGEETFVAIGYPRLFSPDGSQLLFESSGSFLYDLSTNAIASYANIPSYGAAVRWTSEGIISFTPGPYFITIVVKNETTAEQLGEWNSLYGFTPDMVSPKGNSIITGNDICGYPYVTGPCPGYTKASYSIVDVHNDTEQQLVSGVNAYHHLRAFSPDEKNFAYVVNNQLYITQSQN